VLLPVIVVSVLLLREISQRVESENYQKLSLRSQQIASTIEHQLTLVTKKLKDSSNDNDVVMAANNTFFSHRALKKLELIVDDSPLATAAFLLDEFNFVMDAHPPEVADLYIQSIADLLPDITSTFSSTEDFAVLHLEKSPIISETLENLGIQPQFSASEGLAIITPLVLNDYRTSQNFTPSGALVTVLPLENFYQIEKGHLSPTQSLELLINPGHDKKQGTPLSASINLVLGDSRAKDVLNIMVTLSETESVMYEPVRAAVYQIFSIVATLIIILAMTIMVVSRRLTKPIDTLYKLAIDYSQGNYKVRPKHATFQEFQLVEDALSHLASTVDTQLTELSQKNQDLQRIDKLKDDFLAATSHELKTPLHGIVGLSSSMLDGASGDLTTTGKRNIAFIEQSGQRLLALVNDILDLTKLKNSDVTLNFKAIDLRSNVDLVFKQLRHLAQNKPVRLVNAVHPNLPKLAADEQRLHQILHHLVHNAIKFTDEGEVKIEARAGKDDTIAIEISDTGRGIKENSPDAIFQPFYQNADIDHKIEGTGLGLSITRTLVELHGGEIKLIETSGPGTCFRLVFAQASKDLKPSDIRDVEVMEYATPTTLLQVFDNDPEPASTDKAIVLVVDDEPINHNVIKNYFHDTDYRMIPCINGKEALKFAASNRADIVLLDIMMPEINGFELCKMLKELPAYSNVPVIFLTAKQNDEDVQLAYDLGADDYLTKPVQKTELITRIGYHIELSKARRELATVNKQLEEQVVSRTTELRHSLEELEKNNLIFHSLVETSISMQNRSDIDEFIDNTLIHLSALFEDMLFCVILATDVQSIDKNAYMVGISQSEISWLNEQLQNRMFQDVSAMRLERANEESTLFLYHVFPLRGTDTHLLGYFVIKTSSTVNLNNEVLLLFAKQLSSAIENRLLTIRLESQATTDSLTNVNNRLAFERDFERATYRTSRYAGENLGLLIIDVNGLKKLNDTHGHMLGDRVIIFVADVLKQAIRKSDQVYRMGGDEFFVLLAPGHNESCKHLAKRIRQLVQARALLVNENSANGTDSINIALSIGYATTEEYDICELVNVADQRMYEDKKSFYSENNFSE
jgi:diguanylate cyclase (GGDEF)-like protein